ncbi:hypothetical protein CWE09_12015 [Aliidiomarina minuta]|uniref:Uncharacterized protein n=1 Tax=Aliidiomarina minuta TaxID=880057 RepID=A0A432W3G3_9GAMM|nr:hypothetical protein [Aliidiomarina minuta]RUO23872.1 hypothetical protein CWE09_12015 [Aliidiomarina minuta]
MSIFRPQPKPVLALHMQAACFTLIKLMTGQGESHVLALTQSPSLSHVVKTLKQHLSSRPLKNFYRRPQVSLSLSADQYQRLTLNMPQHLKSPEILPTLSWLLEQQGFTPLTQWQWDYQLLTTEGSLSADVMLLQKSVLADMLQTFALSLSQLTLICPESDLNDFAEPAARLLAQYQLPGPLFNFNAADTCARTALAAAGVHHA